MESSSGQPSESSCGHRPSLEEHGNGSDDSGKSALATVDYYNRNAEAFADSTANVDFSAMREKFASRIAPGASVLDFGCGSGRDARGFVERGFRVTATDGSPAMCRIASRLTGLEVRNELFQELSDVEEYDGIWACSSILHLPKTELADVFSKMLGALKHGGVIYTSFKYGTFEGWRNGRYFTDFTEETFRGFLRTVEGVETVEPIEAIEHWVSCDVRPGREGEKWLNLLLKKL